MDNKEQFYQAAYSKNESITVKLEDLLYFKAPLHKGTNDIYMEYSADFGFQTYGFLKNYRLKYSLYPSKFWQSFGPITVNLHLNGLAEITQSNLGKAKIENDVVKWQLSSFDNDLDITINHRTNLLGKALLFIQPIGMATCFSLWLPIRFWSSCMDFYSLYGSENIVRMKVLCRLKSEQKRTSTTMS